MPNSAQSPSKLHKRISALRIASAWLMALVFLVVQGVVPAQAGTTCYVDQANTAGTQDGASWATAWTDLQTALTSTSPVCGNIYVAEGVYKPGATNAASFNVPAGTQIRGGYHTGGDGRDWAAHLTILSGDLAGDDTDANGDAIIASANDINASSENSIHVVTLDGTAGAITDTTILEGLVITAGQADEGIGATDAGGGLYCNGSGDITHACNPSLVALVFSGNYAYMRGGAVYLNGSSSGQSSPGFLNVEFRGNRTSNAADTLGGGALYAGAETAGISNPQLQSVTFRDNYAYLGGAIRSNATGGGTSNPMIVNAIFHGNQADYGGAIFASPAAATSNVTVLNSSFAGNQAVYQAGAIFIGGDGGGTSTLTLRNSIVYGNSVNAGGSFPGIRFNAATGSISYTLLQGGCAGFAAVCGGGILDSDPYFVDIANGDLRVQGNSPTVDAGDNGVVPSSTTTDIVGKSRLVDAPWATDTGAGTAPIVDMGAYETQFGCPAGSVIYVDIDAAPNGGGTSWADAFQDIPPALSNAGYCPLVTEVWVAEGLYVPGTHQDDTIYISFPIGLYGGFEGSESYLSERDPSEHLTVLSGDIAGDDTTNAAGVVVDAEPSLGAIQGTNLYHVVTMAGVDATTVLDGFTITAGAAVDSTLPDSGGGGLLCEGAGYGASCSPTLTNLFFSGNYARYGGAVMDFGAEHGSSSPTVANVTFRGNYADVDGGALINLGYIAGDSSPSLTNVTFYGNSAGSSGGAMSNYGDGGASSPVLKHVTFNDNYAGSAGGAISSVGTGGASAASLTNVILWGDTAGTEDNELHNFDAAPSVTYSVVQGGYAGEGNVDADPMLDALGINGGITPTMALLAGSSALNAGADAACAGTDNLDQRGMLRPQGPHCDIGAYERVLPVADFDGDAASDAGKYVLDGFSAWWLESSSGTWNGLVMGPDSTNYLPHYDFDGDGIIDHAKWVDSSTIWYFGSHDSTWHGIYMGTDVVSLVPGMDFDGDERSDPAKWVDSGYIWYLSSLSSTWQPAYIGTDGVPIAGSDFDGDGKSDAAKFVSDTIWYFGSLDGTWHGVTIGSDGQPIAGSDYDGDGKTDPAKLVSGTIWYLGSLDKAWHGIYLGTDGELIRANDFDGDGKTDAAKWVSAADSIWYVSSSTGSWEGIWLGGDSFDILN